MITTEEEIIGPACRVIVETVLGEEARYQVSKVPLSNNTISRRISEMGLLDLLMIKMSLATTTGHGIFISVSSYLNDHGLSWKDCCGIYTDSAPSMLGKYKGFTTRALNESPSIIRVITHCFLHREALVSKTSGEQLTEVFNQVVKMVNFVKSRPLQCRLFEKLCQEMSAPYTSH